MSGIKWTRRTTGNISEQLATLGIEVSKNTVGRLLKKMVPPSAETEISSPMTPLGTRVRTGAPVAGLSRTSAPRVVTPAIAGGRAVVWLTE